jgi:hypothetical protein
VVMVIDWLKNEADIVWLHDPLRFRYLREANYITTRRTQSPPRGGRLVVGYTVHHKRSVGTTAYSRRFWYLNSWDRDLEPGGPYGVKTFKRGPAPSEAVLPSSIRVGKPSIPYAGSELWKADWEERETIG